MTCIWLIERNGGWEYCGLPAAQRNKTQRVFDDSPLCKHHLELEIPAVFGHKTAGA